MQIHNIPHIKYAIPVHSSYQFAIWEMIFASFWEWWCCWWWWWRLWQSEWWGGREGACTILRDIAKWLSIMLCNTNVCQCVHQCIPMYTNVRTPMYAKWLSIISIILCNTNVPIYVRSCVSNVCHALAPTGTLYVIMIQAAVYLKFNGICYVSTNCFVFTM